MRAIHVCSLADVQGTVATISARHVITAMSPQDPAVTMPKGAHLDLRFHDWDWIFRDGYVPPRPEHVRDLLTFIAAWQTDTPLVVHCFAGISRSTAVAFIALCTLNPAADERLFAQALRQASPGARPNIHIVKIADDILDRRGRMVGAIELIGRDVYAYPGRSFVLQSAA